MKQKQNTIIKADFPLTKRNYIMVIIGFAIMILGFILMIGGGSDDPNVFREEKIFSFRRVTLAPMLILFGLVFEIYAIMTKTKEDE